MPLDPVCTLESLGEVLKCNRCPGLVPRLCGLRGPGWSWALGVSKGPQRNPAGRWAEPHPPPRACGCENTTPSAPGRLRNPALSGCKARLPQTPTSLSVNRFTDTDRPHAAGVGSYSGCPAPPPKLPVTAAQNGRGESPRKPSGRADTEQVGKGAPGRRHRTCEGPGHGFFF